MVTIEGLRGPALLAACAALALAGCGGHVPRARTAPRATTTASRPAAAAPTTTTTQTTTAKPRRRRRPRPDPGRLPQTSQEPSAATRGFRREMVALWKGIRTRRLAPAMSAFFPEAAYVQVKAIGDAQGDWRDRLLANYAADISAAHALLGGGAGGAQLISVRVPAGYAHWVPPGACYNRVGYWETPNSRIVYRENGQVSSFGIASMISWRGIWYVVHLGAVLRSGAGGVVDDPSTGPGYSAPSSTC